MMPSTINPREVIIYRNYFFECEENKAHVSCPLSGFHDIVSRYGKPFFRSRNRKRAIVYYWKNSCFSDFSEFFEKDNS